SGDMNRASTNMGGFVGGWKLTGASPSDPKRTVKDQRRSFHSSTASSSTGVYTSTSTPVLPNAMTKSSSSTASSSTATITDKAPQLPPLPLGLSLHGRKYS